MKKTAESGAARARSVTSNNFGDIAFKNVKNPEKNEILLFDGVRAVSGPALECDDACSGTHAEAGIGANIGKHDVKFIKSWLKSVKSAGIVISARAGSRPLSAPGSAGLKLAKRPQKAYKSHDID